MQERKWKTLLEPYAVLLASVLGDVEDLRDEDLTKLQKACGYPTTTNCWYWTYKVSKMLKEEIDIEVQRRKVARGRAK